MINIRFFASLREALDCESISLPAKNISKVSEVKAQLIAQHPKWETHLAHDSILNAVNHQMVDGEYVVKQGDEVAFFPPVTGG